MSLDGVQKELAKGRGKQFDPSLLEAFNSLIAERFVRGGMSLEDYRMRQGAPDK